MADLRIPYAVLASGDEELINTWREMQKRVGGEAMRAIVRAVNALTASANKGVYWTGASTAALFDLTAYMRTLLDDADAGTARSTLDAQQDLNSLLSFVNGDIIYYNSGLQRLAKGTDGQFLKQASGIPSWAAGSGGLALDATDTADGTAEHLQVTTTETPSSVKRMVCKFRGLVPEVDGDTLNITVIDSADTEITSADYYREGWFKVNSSALTGTSAAMATVARVLATTSNSVVDREVDVDIWLMSHNTAKTDSRKHFWISTSYTESVAGFLRAFGESFAVKTSNSIKGFRIDTDNAGDMINEGVAELWVQT